MKVILNVVHLFTFGNTNGCIMTQLPKNAKIVNLFTAERDAIILVQSNPESELENVHFHLMPVGQIIDGANFEYIGTFVFQNINGLDKILAPLVKITEYEHHSGDIKESTAPDYIPITESEKYELFGIEKPVKKKRKYTRKKKEEGDR